jgi:hypothetical protein
LAAKDVEDECLSRTPAFEAGNHQGSGRSEAANKITVKAPSLVKVQTEITEEQTNSGEEL